MSIKYRTAFRSPQGAKLFELSVVDMVKHILVMLTGNIDDFDFLECEQCPLKYELVGEKDIKYCWLVDDYKVYHNNNWSKPKCSFSDHHDQIIKLIQSCYGE